MIGTLAPAKLAGATLMLMLCLPAHAADIAVPYTKAPPRYNWAGFYGGVNVGGAITEESATTSVVTFSDNPSGVIAGGQLGYNFLPSPGWLLGIEGEFDWASAQDNVIVPSGNFVTASSTVTGTNNWYSTLDARVGSVQGPWLYYVKGGAAWMDSKYVVTNGAAMTIGPSVSGVSTGWTVGAGVEYLLPSGWSAKVEYDFLDLRTPNLTNTAVTVTATDQVHQFKLGLNYHWSP
jgi:outer membrane immunogenic protein